jgi:hypothetical protein
MKKPMKVFLAFGAALVAVSALALITYSRTTRALPDDLGLVLSEAREANFSHDLERERRLLEHGETLEGTEEDHAEVQRWLALMDWKYWSRFAAARDRLLGAADGAEPAEAWLAMARMEQAGENFAAAREAARHAADRAETGEESRRARIAFAQAAVGEAVRFRLLDQIARTDPLVEAFRSLQDEVSVETGVLETSRLLLQAALLLNRGDAAMMAWRSYFHAPAGEPMPNAVADAGGRLVRILPEWKGASATLEERIDLAQALAGSRLFQEAALIARDPRGPAAIRENPGIREIIAYADGLDEVRKLTVEFYRKTALGIGDPDDYQESVAAVGGSVAPRLLGVDPEALPSEQELTDLLEERFGAFISLDKTAGYFDLHMGHRVIDETRTVEQYGHSAELRFVSLDNMVSNGFQSWAWEGGAQHGGWAGPDTIWQVRPAYASDPLEIWRRLHSEQELQDFMEEMDRETGLDEARAAENPYSFLPGLSMRLKYQGITGILEELNGDGLDDEALRLAFLAAYEHTVQESSIFAHEGRHAIEKRRDSSYQSGWKAEFSAKLSEVAFAPRPRLAFGGIVSAGIGDRTPHGRANLKIMKGLIAWMEEHRAEIKGFDPGRPLLPQFDRLTDEQMRVAIRSMDPLAEG